MSKIIRDHFYINDYPEYKPVLRIVLKLFLQAKKEKKIAHLSDVDHDIAYLFNTNNVYAGKLRKFYYPTREQKKSKSSKDDLEEITIGHFDFYRLKELVKQHEMDICDESYEVILACANLALPVSEVLKEVSNFNIHTGIKEKVKGCIKEIDLIMRDRKTLKISLFKYLHQFRSDELVWWLLATLPTIDELKVKKWISSFGNVTSNKEILTLINSAEKYGYLLEFNHKFRRINEKNHKNIYDNILALDLLCAYAHIDYFEQFAHTGLRADDVYLTYLIVSTLDSNSQEVILEQIGHASKAKLPIDFTPPTEVIIDWNTHTCWPIY